jgi:uncharacterized protein (TIGR00369 family)
VTDRDRVDRPVRAIGCGFAYRARVTDAAPVADPLAPNASRFALLPPATLERWVGFPQFDPPLFPTVVGLRLEEVRRDYARMRLPYRPELNQPAGVVHGGAIMTLIDTVVVPAVSSGYDEPMDLFTVSLTTNFMGPVIEDDAVAEGWIERRGRTTIFCRVEVRTASRGLVGNASLVYTVRPRRA